MEQAIRAVYMGIAAILFALAVWILLRFDAKMSDTNHKLNANQRNAEVIQIG
jgi:hypothetical protein